MHRTAFAPAGVGNLAAGFDLLGHTLDGPRDRVTVRRIEAPEVRVAAIRGDVPGLDVIPFDVARNTARADYAVSVTGIAGPDGGSEKKPVGLVYIAVSSELATVVIEHRFGDIGRDAIRKASVQAALELVLQVLTSDQE